jgi:hypothetical protein
LDPNAQRHGEMIFLWPSGPNEVQAEAPCARADLHR